SYGSLVIPLIVAGVGISLALPIAPTVVVSAVKPHEMGKASGVNSTAQRFGAAFAIAVGASIFAANGHLGSAAAFTSGFRPALLVVASLSFAGAVIALAVDSRRASIPTPAVAKAA